jgi:hypothetical protein
MNSFQGSILDTFFSGFPRAELLGKVQGERRKRHEVIERLKQRKEQRGRTIHRCWKKTWTTTKKTKEIKKG